MTTIPGEYSSGAPRQQTADARQIHQHQRDANQRVHHSDHFAYGRFRCDIPVP